MSDSDETVGSDSDVTLPPDESDNDRCYSPDLFDEPEKQNTSKVMPSKGMSPVKTARSKTHEISDSGSDSDSEARKNLSNNKKRNVNEQRKKGDNSSQKCETTRKDNSIKSKKQELNGKRKTEEKDTELQKVKGSEENDATKKFSSDKKKFVNEFLDMTDSDSDDEFKQNQKKIKELKKKAEKEKMNRVELPKKSSDVGTKDNALKEGQERKSPDGADEHTFSQKPHKKNYSKPYDKGDSHSSKTDSKKHGNKKELESQSPASSHKRKHSKSPVPRELRKAVTEVLKQNENGSAKKTKTPCQYGLKCYRKNPSHFEEFSHPGEEESAPPTKKRRSESPLPSTSKKKDRIQEKNRSSSPSTSKSRPDSPSTTKSKVKTHSPTADCKVIKRSRSPSRDPTSIQEKLQLAEPYSFFLTRVVGIPQKYNATYVMDIKDILSEEMGNLTASCQFNYMFDIQWLMKQYPQKFRSKPLLIVHGEHGASMTALQARAANYSNIRFCQAKLEMMYGTHHTKMMLLLYDDGMRIVIHTSNLIEGDWYQKSQGMWISPLFPKLLEPGTDKGDSPTHFKRDIIEYIQAYKAYQLKDWIDHIVQHDMSSARVVVIGSVPGRHTEGKKSMWGHMKLRKVLQEHGPQHATVKSWPVIGQFSSIGSMGPNKENWLCGEWQQSLATTKSGSGPQSSSRLLLIFPSRHNVRLSLEGYVAGGSIPYSVNTAKKQTFLHDFFHVWKSEGRGRSRAMPHIKTYARPMQDGSKAAWFLVTSANLSKAAWGALEKKGAQLMIRSYEIGVLFLPKFFDEGESFPITSEPEKAATSNRFLLPYDLPPTIYDKSDRPWMWDIPYTDLPDTNGNMWCPFSK